MEGGSQQEGMLAASKMKKVIFFLEFKFTRKI